MQQVTEQKFDLSEIINSNNPTVYKLRAAGVKVRVHHFRYARKFNFMGNPLSEADNTLIPLNVLKNGHSEAIWPKGGLTKIEVTFPNGRSYIGEADCSLEDQFKRKLGIRIALNRVLLNIQKPSDVVSMKETAEQNVSLVTQALGLSQWKLRHKSGKKN